jgi:hypothetical protein
VSAPRTDAVREIVGYFFDREYIRRDGVLYEEWCSYGGHHSRQITEAEIPATATRYNPPIAY